MGQPERRFAGIDVGGRRKGFHFAVIQGRRVVVLEEHREVGGLVEQLVELGPEVIGIDSPPEWAPDGEKSRPAEREFSGRKVCGIRYTPDRTTAEAHDGNYFSIFPPALIIRPGFPEGCPSASPLSHFIAELSFD